MVDFNKDDCTHLVLTRKHGERILVDGPASFEVVEDKGGRSKVSVRAPRTTKILREELADKPRRPAA